MPGAMRDTFANRRTLPRLFTQTHGLWFAVAIGVFGGAAHSAAAEMTPGALAPQRFVIDVTLELTSDSLMLKSARAAAPSVLAPPQAPPLSALPLPMALNAGTTLSAASLTSPLLGGLEVRIAPPIDAAWSAQQAFETATIDRTPSAAPISFSKYTQEIAARAQQAGGAAAEVYAARNHAPIWLRPTRFGRVDAEAAAALTSVLIKADLHGVAASRYEAAALGTEAMRAAAVTGWRMTPAELAGLELRFTSSLLKYANDMGGGLVRPRAVDHRIDRSRPQIDLTAKLLAIADAADREIAPYAQRTAAADNAWEAFFTNSGPLLLASLDALAPNAQDYRDLQTALAAARVRAAALDNAPLVKVKKRLEPGETSAAVAAVRQRLTLLGYLDPSAETANPEHFDADLAAAIRQYQAHTGLKVDGVIGKRTSQTLNLSGTERVKRIIANLERARWMNFPQGDRHIRVNLPDMHAMLIEDGRTLLRTRTVIGKPGEQETPEFSDKMEYLVVNPSWHVPRSIAAGKLLDKLKQDPTHLVSQNMVLTGADGVEVNPWTVDWTSVTPQNFNFRIRQRPGRGNALGAVKFMFPNNHAVYLHDTSEPHLFSRSSRAFSHGCVRVADPSLLAERLLAQQIPEAAAFYEKVRQSASEDRHIWLEEPLPVHIDYRTAWIGDDGRLQTRSDIYKRDAKLLNALREAGLPL